MSVRVQLQVIAEHRNMLIMSMMRNNIPSATASHRSHSGCTLPSSCNLLSKLRVEVIQMQVRMTKRDDGQPFYNAQEEDINGIYLHTLHVTTAYQNQLQRKADALYKKVQRADGLPRFSPGWRTKTLVPASSTPSSLLTLCPLVAVPPFISSSLSPSHMGVPQLPRHMLMGNRSPDEFYLCTQRCRIGNAPLNYRQTGTWKTMWHPLYRYFECIKVIITGLPFVVYKLHAGIELVESEAVLDSNPVRSCKLNVQRNSALNSKISR
ncbi:hypothetical protein ALC62_05395 [Cyphomyrmex costatus]|uniref:Uncharacterized protein n=1 Tax=Cyphomyrmex costatus TaxID=456900 RepID=A0A195CU85_9HYME|nr:hypothetical protein ALC62_05395 [Cyphomyrmex costatus]